MHPAFNAFQPISKLQQAWCPKSFNKSDNVQNNYARARSGLRPNESLNTYFFARKCPKIFWKDRYFPKMGILLKISSHSLHVAPATLCCSRLFVGREG